MAAVIAGAQAPVTWPAVHSEVLVSSEWLASHLSDPNVVVVDVARTTDVYSAGHIPGARLLARKDVGDDRNGLSNEFPPVKELVASIQKLGVGENSRVVLYDEAAGLDAARAFVAFDYAGYGGRAAILDGQWKRWKAENRPVTAEKPPVTASTWAPKPRTEILARLDNVRELSEKAEKPGASVSLVDARPDAQYKGEQKQEGIARPGHIPGAQCIFWQKNIVSQENPVMRPVDELHDLYAAAGLDPKNEVVTYCTTGGQASFEYFALRYLGYKVRFYDGSYEEWNAAPGTRVETTAR
jgi:thiosulfate/3-mercaptopyruvate sulfurtransferase